MPKTKAAVIRGSESTESLGGNDWGNPVLFDIDAIKKELLSEMIEVRELDSTLPPMQISSRLGRERRHAGSQPDHQRRPPSRCEDGARAARTGPRRNREQETAAPDRTRSWTITRHLSLTARSTQPSTMTTTSPRGRTSSPRKKTSCRARSRARSHP